MKFIKLLQAELIQHLRTPVDNSLPIIFFVIVVSLYPLALSPDMKFLTPIAPGIVWISILLAILMGLNKFYLNDFEDGSLLIDLLSPNYLLMNIYSKTIAYWVTTCLPLILLTPILCLGFNISMPVIKTLLLTLLLGTPALCLICGFCSALTLGLKKANTLIMILILPLTIPIVILATTAINLQQQDIAHNGHLMILLAILLFSISVLPILTQLALRLSDGE